MGFLVLLAATGRLHPLFAALSAAVPLLIRAVNLIRLAPMIRQLMHALGLSGLPGAAAGTHGPGGRGRTSSIRARFLEMTLDHGSGEMDGLILEGALQGCRLSELELEQLLDLLTLCRSKDAQSAALLEAYLDRRHGSDWRQRARGEANTAPPSDTAPLTREEAFSVLGLEEGASAEEIRHAHRRLIQRFHPDRGGSDYLAAKINAAKRLLLDE